MKITRKQLKRIIKEEARRIEEVYFPGDTTTGEEEFENAMYTWVSKNNLQMSTRHMQEFVLNLLKKASDDLRMR